MSEKTRRSNFELMRIVAILIIIGSHLSSHGLMDVGKDYQYIQWYGSNWYNKLFSALLVPGGDVGVGAFFILSGFFLAGKKRIRSLNRIVSQTYFYAIICAILGILGCYVYNLEISKMSLLKNTLLPLTSEAWWYVTAYVLLIMIMPYLNAFLDSISNNGLLAIIVIWWILGYSSGKVFAVTFYGLIRGTWYYLIGAYIARKTFKMRSGIELLSIGWGGDIRLQLC